MILNAGFKKGTLVYSQVSARKKHEIKFPLHLTRQKKFPGFSSIGKLAGCMSLLRSDIALVRYLMCTAYRSFNPSLSETQILSSAIAL